MARLELYEVPERSDVDLMRPLALVLSLALPACAPAAPPPPALTRAPVAARYDSDTWVAANVRVQRTYARVLAVAASGVAPRTVRVRPLDLTGRLPAAEVELPVDHTFSTLQAAADAARGGDLVAVLPGRYAGFTVDDRPGAGDDRYVHFKALGAPFEVTIDAPTPADGARWMVLIRAAHHVVIEGFDIAGHAEVGVVGGEGPWAGVMLDGDFGRSGALTHHVVVAGNYSHHHQRWGLHATDTRAVLLQDNVFAASASEHAAYVSDGSDEYVIRRNVFFGSAASGLQINLDPEASLHEVMKHRAFAGWPTGRSHAWAEGVIARADQLFGPRGYPDGRGQFFIVEGNVINDNGRRGGGALNLAGLSDSLIQNNLLYGNHAHGIAQWDNDNPYDRELEVPGPRVPGDVTGPASLPAWGCQRNVVRNNTVIMAAAGRAAFQAVHGSWGTVVANNVLINDEPVSVEVSSTGIYRLAFGPNVVNAIAFTRGADALASLALAMPDPARTATGVTRARFAGEVERYGAEPWILLDARGFRLNPARPDFHPRAGSALLAGRADPAEMPPRDLEGSVRCTADIGALRAAPAR